MLSLEHDILPYNVATRVQGMSPSNLQITHFERPINQWDLLEVPIINLETDFAQIVSNSRQKTWGHFLQYLYLEKSRKLLLARARNLVKYSADTFRGSWSWS